MNRMFQPNMAVESIETMYVTASRAPRRSNQRLAEAHKALAAFEAQLELHARWGLSAAHKVLFEKHRRKLHDEIARAKALSVGE